MDAKDMEKKAKKKKKAKSNQTSVDFCIVGSDGAVKEVVKKKKKSKAADGAAEGAAPAKREREEKAEATDEEKAAKKARKAEKRARKEAKAAKRATKAEGAAAEAEAAPEAAAPAKPDGFVRAHASSNPNGVTRLFVGNLPWKITDEGVAEALGCACPTIKYITDKESGKFYGSAFVECGDAASAAAAVARAGAEVNGRPVKITYAPPRPGDVWPPVDARNSAERAARTTVREKTPRPEEGVTKLFVGNVAYEATDEDVEALFKEAAPSGLRAIRWVTHKDTGAFKGCGYLVFHNIEECDAAVKLDGAVIHGRPLRLDYTPATTREASGGWE